MRPGLLLFLVLRWAIATAQPPPGYYDPAAGLSGPALKQALNTIITGHTVLLYSALWGAFTTTDDRPDGFVWDVYSDVPGGAPAYLFTFGTDQCGSYDSEGDCYNREHSFPASWFNDVAPMNTDLHHIYPTDAWVNQHRGNWPYGTVTSPTWTSTNGSKLGPCTWPGCTGTAFEPINDFKGDLARSYFYMMTRYLPSIANWTGPMTTGGDLSPWAESLLLTWHLSDPVSSKETDRNNAIYALQHNRNPYIDHPEWVEAIWGPNAGTHGPEQDAGRCWYTDGALWMTPIASTSRISLVDALGRNVLAAEVPPGLDHLAIALPPGLYCATIASDARLTTLRFVR